MHRMFAFFQVLVQFAGIVLVRAEPNPDFTASTQEEKVAVNLKIEPPEEVAANNSESLLCKTGVFEALCASYVFTN